MPVDEVRIKCNHNLLRYQHNMLHIKQVVLTMGRIRTTIRHNLMLHTILHNPNNSLFLVDNDMRVLVVSLELALILLHREGIITVLHVLHHMDLPNMLRIHTLNTVIRVILHIKGMLRHTIRLKHCHRLRDRKPLVMPHNKEWVDRVLLLVNILMVLLLVNTHNLVIPLLHMDTILHTILHSHSMQRTMIKVEGMRIL